MSYHRFYITDLSLLSSSLLSSSLLHLFIFSSSLLHPSLLPSLLLSLYHFHHLHPTKKFQNFSKKKKKKKKKKNFFLLFSSLLFSLGNHLHELYQWLGQHLVVERVSTQPNLHQMYWKWLKGVVFGPEDARSKKGLHSFHLLIIISSSLLHLIFISCFLAF